MNINWSENDTAKGFLMGTLASAAVFGTTAWYLIKQAREEALLTIETIEKSYEGALNMREATHEVEIQRLTRMAMSATNVEVTEDGVEMTIHDPLNGTGLFDTKGTVVDDIPEGVQVTKLEDEPVRNQYHTAVATMGETLPLRVEGGVNDYGVSYIQEDVFEDDDSHDKNHVDIILDDGEPKFIMDNQYLENWETLLGDSILVDFYQMCPPGTEQILYVRNHRTQDDYEVVRVNP